MRVTSLKLANLRAIEAAEFRFHPGFNLVVGVNGVGKTTILDALAVCLSAFVRRANKLPRYEVQFDLGDIREGAAALDVDCDIEGGAEKGRYGYTLHKTRETIVPREGKAGLPREQVRDTPGRAEFVGSKPPAAIGDDPGGRPMAILFSPRRSIASERAPAKRVAEGGVNAAFSGALSNRRELHLREFEAWMRVQEALTMERPAAKRVLAAFEAAVTRFLPDYRNPRLGGESVTGSFLLIDRGAATLPVEFLSDGERGLLAMVLDLTRRLSQANPEMEDPAAEAEAVVLIDEIELHLHPAWQRRIVRNLTETFPKCQFIATTHSPQVIGEVEHDRIQIIADGQVYSPTHSFGVDSNRVLEEIMDADPRTQDVKELLSKISRKVGKQRYESARELLAQLVDRLGEDDPEVSRIRTLLDFMAGDE
ncbi:MAG: AAA family ATPase [Gemmatimonadetes bacterium]|nr:AAA family ATPase [Gemmatimonadota bacterium]